MRRVQWSDSARADMLGQIEHIARDDPAAARRVVAALLASGDALGAFATGHPGRVAGTYEKSVQRLPYIIAYALTDHDSAVTILRVVHTSRDWREDEWPE